MLDRLAHTLIRRRKAVLLATLAFVVVAGAVGGGVAKHLSSGGFDDPNAENTRVRRLLEQRFPQGAAPNLVLLVTARHGTVDSAEVAAEGRRLTAELAGQPSVGGLAFSYWTIPGATPLESRDGRQALVLARIAGDDDAVAREVKKVAPAFTRNDATVSVRVGGYAEVFHQMGTTIEHDLKRAESIAVPVTMALLVLVFGSLVAASLPLGVGALAVLGTFLVLRLLAAVTQVSIYSLNLTTMMGLGLAIDYSLFMVSRYREELRSGSAPHPAVVATVATAGRTVLFSAMTVAASLAALWVFPLAFLRSFAYAGIAVVALAAVGAVVVLPAFLAVLGTRVERFTIFKRRPAPEPGSGAWHRIATTVMRRPVLVGGTVVAALLVLGTPFLHIRFGLADDRALPVAASSRRVQDAIRSNFVSDESGALSVVADGIGDPARRAQEIDGYATGLSRLGGVARVDAVTGTYLRGARAPLPVEPRLVARMTAPTGTFLNVIPSVEPVSPAGERLVKAVRGLRSPFPVKVGGPSAQLVDAKASLFGRMPVAGLIIALVTFTVLFLMTGSVVVPLKAVVLNLLSLTATFGAMVWVFQDGHLAHALHFTATGVIDTTSPILMFCIAFGLSMDYEVFLLSRIKEEHDRSGDNVSSVALGLERTGRIVTAAAALLAVVFVSFATSGVTFIKLFGLGLTMAVLVDATLVRAALVPAFMRLAGDANWWAPGPLRRFHRRYGLSESAPAPRDAVDGGGGEPGKVLVGAGAEHRPGGGAGPGRGNGSLP